MTKRAVAEVTIEASPNAVSNALIQIMWASRIHVTGQTITEHPPVIHLYGDHSMSLRSWGETITVTITGVSNRSKVSAESQAKLPTTAFDYGQNKENLEVLLNQLVIKFRSTSSVAIEERTF